MDVARSAGVSKSLVSLAIRGEPGVSERTRAHVVAVAEELGYRSNRWARSLKNGETNLIGVLLTDLDSSYATDVVQAVEDTAAEEGYEVVLAHGRRDASTLLTQVVALRELGVEGLVVVSALADGLDLERVAAGTPTVVVGRPARLPDSVASVANHDAHGTRQVVEHLVALGHRRIHHAARNTRPASLARRDAYLEAMRTMALDDLAGVVMVDALDRLVAEVAAGGPQAPTAVFASNDRLAADLVGRCLDAGLDVPGRLSIVGYDNTAPARLVRPQLTTVDQPRTALGRLAMTRLTEQIGGSTSRRHEVVEPRLVVRASTAPPAA